MSKNTNHEIISEDFSLTESISEQVHLCIDEINSIQSRESIFHVFLSKDGPKTFSVKIRTHTLGADVFVESKDDDVYHALLLAKAHAKRKIQSLSEQKHESTRRRN